MRRAPTRETVIAIESLGLSRRKPNALRDVGGNEEPLRAELFGIEQLKRHAVTLAGRHRIDPRRQPDRLLPRLAENARVLLAAYDLVATSSTQAESTAPAEAWLLDNFHLIEQQIGLARRHLPGGYSRQLPRLASGPSAGLPRIYDLALELISHMDGRVDSANATEFIAAYQSVDPLKLGELWAFPIMLQLALLENLRRVAVRIARRREERDAAVTWANRMLVTAEHEPSRIIQLLAAFADADVPLTASFVEEFYARVQSQGPAMAFVQAWVEHRLFEQGVTAMGLSQASARMSADNQISMANSIGSLRFIGAMDWSAFVESLSVVERTLREDPAGLYARQDFATRDRYRHVVENTARHCAGDEADVARAAVGLARQAATQRGPDGREAHVGYFLIDRGRPDLEQAVGCRLPWPSRAGRAIGRIRLPLYVGAIVLLTALVTAWALWASGGLAAGDGWLALLMLPLIVAASALSVPLVNRAVTLALPPRALPRLDFSAGIPDGHRTMVIVPTLMATPQDVDDLLEAMEIRYLGNRDPNLYFALLTDFHDASERTLPVDDVLLEHARAGVRALNETYREDRPCVFHLFHRPRTWNAVERVWMGYERKRGKLEQFNALLRGGAREAFSEIVGDRSLLASIRYVITLDTDTQLPRDAARSLVGNLAHPLVRPVYDAARGRVVDGYAILQPRASISLTSACRSRFARLLSGEAGIDPYTREVSDVYQDLFGEGSFVGKGIYDVDAFRLALDGRFPENLVLSHDLLEGSHARSALVTDVELIEEHPASCTVEASRRHRWIRGDWQLVAWLLPRVPGPCGPDGAQTARRANPLSALSRWKLLDNLRRSLVPPALLAVLAAGWLTGPGPAWFWTLVVAGIVFVPTLMFVAIELLRKGAERDWPVHLILAATSAGRPVAQAVLTLVFLPYDTLICLGAILRSGARMPFTRRGLLLWQLPAYACRNARRTLVDFVREMGIAPVVALALVGALSTAGHDPSALLGAAPVLVLWLLAPVVGWWISQPLVTGAPEPTAEQRLLLRTWARRTWRFFADFVGPQDNWLPPDNFQEHPAPAIASRTSPTNMGMALLAELAAHDFGYATLDECLRRLGHMLASMERLERHRGHLYNWYDTRTLLPLNPRYVSSVDSGNLAGSLLTLQAGLIELKARPVLGCEAFRGLEDTLRVLAGCLSTPATAVLAGPVGAVLDVLHTLVPGGAVSTPGAFGDALEAIGRAGGGMAQRLPADVATDDEARYWAGAFDRQCDALRDELAVFAPLSLQARAIPSLSDLAGGPAGDVPASVHAAAAERLGIIDTLLARCRRLAAMEFGFLVDAATGLLAIGYDVDERRRDPSCYDLLASEARLASFLLVAQGQLPQKHWFALGRLLTSQGADVTLISWSGSMFEYLMPQVMMPSYADTLLDRACRGAVSRQIEYGRQRGVPWGISESCYNATDTNHVYQYRAFGVPGLGFKRGLADDLVIAPYASALALTVLPNQASRNLQTLADQGFLGDYGFYEAIDYTRSRVPRGRPHVVVRSFMAHHQGMSLLAFAHVLLDRPMQRRFMSDPLVRATHLLLQERVPKRGATLHPHAAEVSAAARPPGEDTGAGMRVFTDPNSPIPEVHLLSNGRYHVMVTHAGGSYSRCGALAVTRWREDATCDGWGTFVYLRDRDSGRSWSSAHQPTQGPADRYEAIFVQARAEYRRRDQAIDTHTEICVAPDDDVEIRRITLVNGSPRRRRIELTSYAEVVLAPLNADLAHRAFSNLFVQTEILPERQAILCTRRPRTPEERAPWMFHLFAAPGATADEASYETDRARFVGRGRTVADPVALDNDGPAGLSNTAGPVLDPIVAIRRTVTLSPDESATVQIISGVADSREGALALLDKYCDRHIVERAFESAWFQSQETLRQLNVTETDAQAFGRLAGSVVYASGLRRAPPGIIARNRSRQSGLWRFGISGDLPIVLLHIGDVNRIDRARYILHAHAYWRLKGLPTDLVIVNEDFSGYRAVLQDLLTGLINAGPKVHGEERSGAVFVRRADELSEDERVLLQTVARIVFDDGPDTLIELVERRRSATRPTDRLEAVERATVEPVTRLAERDRLFDNGLGGFTRDGREYVITLEPGRATPAPWVNVIASPHIGTVVSESGSAYTWAENAHEFRLTAWHNDPVSDASGEAFYIRDEQTGVFWSPTPLPARGRSGYVCRHGFGYSVFEHVEQGIASALTTYVAMDAPVKFVVLTVRNQSARTRSVSLTGYWELVMGEWRHGNLMHVVTETDPDSGALFAHNAYGRECANRVVFAHVGERERSLSGSRAEFIGRNGSLAAPAAMRRRRLSGRTGAGLDPCAAVQTRIELAPGQEHEFVFTFGAGRSADDARDLVRRFGGRAGARGALEAVWEHWSRTLGAVHVETPDPALNVLANGWLVYQTLSCRLWGRSGYYQSGGAYGFRDQLQDTMALIHTTPWLAREQLIRCAERQFLKGDVQHWWHPPNGQGVRTHFSDDYLWLPHATCRYVLATGDTGVLDEPVHFLEGRELNPEEEAYYDQPQRSSEAASLYEHCVRAIRHGLRFGPHELPLMGCGDWNDGMNLVGREGRGESVWLAWFLYRNLDQFAALARGRGDPEFAELCGTQAERLRASIEQSAWDGAWYRRAWFDDGTPLGSAVNDECRIDSISQSWAVLSGGGDPARARRALEAVDAHLVQRDDGLVKLLDPPFDRSALEPGYIKGYVPGVRENGGQYTHAAIWTTMAFAGTGDTERAWELLDMLNPVHHGSTPEAIERYKVEPYVMSADIYAAAPHTGRGGWTWYTGAAGWMYRLILESMLGLTLEAGYLCIAPCIPARWRSYTVHYRYRDTVYRIVVRCIGEDPLQVSRVTVDGEPVDRVADDRDGRPRGRVRLVDDRQEHSVEVDLG